MTTTPATIGFRVKTGRATAVLLAGSPKSPQVLERRSVQLWNPSVPESQQPYHAAMDLSEKEAAVVVRRATEAVQSLATSATRELAGVLLREGRRLCGVGLVVGSDIDPEKLHNAHIRAHALEGRLFREALEAAAKDCGVPCMAVVERDAFTRGATTLGYSPGELKRIVKELGQSVGRPWGGEEKTAALAAWIMLSRRQ